MEYLVEGSPKVKLFVESLMPSILAQVGLTRSRKAVLIKVDELEPGHEGATLNIEVADCMIVILRKPTRVNKRSLLDLGVTLAHEMVHVAQLARGDLKFLARGAKEWKGKRYAKSVPYLDQPWEIAALSRQELIFRRALEV